MFQLTFNYVLVTLNTFDLNNVLVNVEINIDKIYKSCRRAVHN